MRTDKLMINTDRGAIAAFQRALGYKAAAAVVVVLCFVVIGFTAPDNVNADASIAPTVVHETARIQADLIRGADVDDPVTHGVDMHG